MAVRSTRRQSENHTAAIQTSRVLKCLQDHLFKGSEMLPTQIKSAEILLKKTVPDLKQVDIQGNLEVSGSWTVKLG